MLGFLPAILTALVLESLLTGVSIVFSAVTAYILIRRRRRALSFRGSFTFYDKLFSVVLVINIVAGVVHWILNVNRAFDAFIHHPDKPVQILANLSDVTRLINASLYQLESYIADCMIVFRLYLIYNRERSVIIIPCLTLLATQVCIVGIVVNFSQSPQGANIFSSTLDGWLIGSFATSICTNFYSCMMITYRINKTNREVRIYVDRDGSPALKHALHIIWSGVAIYTIFSLVMFGAYIAKSNLYPIIVDVASPSINIIFCTMVVRVAYQRNHCRSASAGSDSGARISTFIAARPLSTASYGERPELQLASAYRTDSPAATPRTLDNVVLKASKSKDSYFAFVSMLPRQRTSRTGSLATTNTETTYC